MCTTGGDDGDTYLEARPKLIEASATCRKCKVEKAQVVLQIKDVYCKDCFLSLCNHKFRAVLGKSRVFGNEPTTVLVAFSGSSSSLALVRLLSDAAAAGPQHRRIMARPNLLYIDEGALLGTDAETRTEQIKQIKSTTEGFGFPVYFVPLNVDQATPDLIQNSAINIEYVSKVKAMFESLPDETSKLALLTRIRNDVMETAAKHLNIPLVMLADSSTSVAVKILTGIALGQGASISLETGFSDSRHPGITFIRPLRDFTSKEIIMFNIFSGCSNPVFIPSLLTMSDADSSIQRLTEEFVVSLQTDFPSTVSTIYRTGEKFNIKQCSRSCSLCLGPLDTTPKSCSALEATEYSSKISTGKKDAGGCGNCKCKSDGKLIEALCYSCRKLAQSMKNPQLLPKYVLDRAMQSQALAEMKSQIEEFLIEDDDE